jgi:hypothetical protein
MEIKLLLAKAISAVYYASYIPNHDADALTFMLDRALVHIVVNDDPNGSGREQNAIQRLRGHLVWMKQKGIAHPYDLNDMMVRVRLACGDNDRLYDLFCRTLLVVDDPDAAAEKVKEVSHELYDFIGVEELFDTLKKASHRVGFNRDKIENLSKWRDELILKLQELPLAGKRRAVTAVRSLDFNDIENITQAYEMAQAAIDPNSILKLGLKAKNRMYGEQYGVRRGEWGNTSALPGNNKSGDLLDDFMAMCIFNSPTLIDKTKKPMHVLATLEDKPELILQKLYVGLKQHETKYEMPIKTKGVPADEMASYVSKRLTENGWNVRILDYTTGASPFDLIADLEEIKKEGFEIFSLGIDYPHLMDKSDIVASVAGEEAQLVVRIIRRYTSPNNIAVYGVHQLSTQAKELARNYPDYIKRLPGGGYYESCKKLETEFDFAKLIAKTMHNGFAYLEYQWEKHRKMGSTAEEDKYFAVKFLPHPMMGVKWDIDLEEDTSFKKVGGRLTAGEPGQDWTDFD